MDMQWNTIKGHARNAYEQTGIGTRLIIGATIVSNLLSVVFRFPLGARVARIVPPQFYPWVFITAGFYEPAVLKCVMCVFLLFKHASVTERSWGSKELIRFSVIVSTIATLSMMLLSFILALLTQSFYFLSQFEARGFGALLCGFAVALKKVQGENRIIFVQNVGVQAHYLVHVYLGYYLLVAITMGAVAEFVFALLGTFSAWVYLRVAQQIPGHPADIDDDFAFVAFFPDSMRPYAQFVSNEVSTFVKTYIPRLAVPDVHSEIADALERGAPDILEVSSNGIVSGGVVKEANVSGKLNGGTIY